MAVKRKEIRLYIEKIMLFTIRTSYRFARDHPFVFSLVLFLLILYRSSPLVFSLLISSSPVIICTTLLLGLLLSFGEPNIPEIHLHEQKNSSEVSSLKVGATVNDLYVENDGKLTVENHVRNREDREEIVASEAVFGKRKAAIICKSEDKIITAATQYERHENAYSIEASSSSGKQENEEIDGMEKMVEEMGFRSYEITENREIDLEKQDEDLKEELSKVVISSSSEENKEPEGLRLEIGKELDPKIDSSLGSPWQNINSNVTFSDSESDGDDSSSSDASMADIIPILDELSSFIDSKKPQVAHLLKEDSDATSQGLLSDQESDDDGVREEAEAHDDEEDEEVQGKRDNETEGAVIWTEDDHKNLMDLGSSEIERNRRLESLIAKRIARKNLMIAMERNFNDLDPNETKDDLSSIRHVPRIAAPRQNPFDEEEMLMPGSAPSSLLPRRNPFDVTHDKETEASSSQREPWGHQEFTLDSDQDIWFKRNETFNFDRRPLGQQGRSSRLMPYFVPETMEAEEGNSPAVERQLSGNSDSKVSSIPESDSVSSISDHDYHKERIGEESHQEAEIAPPADHDTAPMDQRSQSSDDFEPVTIELKNDNISDGCEIVLGSPEASQEISYSAEAFGSVIDEDRDEIDLTSTATYFEKFEVVEDHYDEPSSPSFSEEDEESFNTTSHEHLPNFQQEGDLREPLLAEAHEIGESINDSGPVAYSRVPSHGEASDYAGKGVYATSSLESASEEFLSDSWKITEFALQDPIEVVSSVIHNDSKQLISSSPTEPDAVGSMDHLNFASTVTGSTARTATEVTSSHATEESDISPSNSLQVPKEDVEGVNPKIKDGPMSLSFPKSEFNNNKTSAVPDIQLAINQIQSLNSSNEESDDIHPLVVEHKDFDESLLSELDVVGDFHSEGLRSNLRSSDLDLGTGGQSRDSVTGFSYLDLHNSFSVQQTSENKSVESQLGAFDSEVSYSIQSSDVNLKRTVYNPRFQGKPTEENESEFDDFLEPAMPLSFSESDLLKLLQQESGQSSKSYLAKRNLEQALTVPELSFLEVIPAESMNSATQICEESEIKYTNHEVKISDDLLGGQNMVPIECQSDMHFIKAGSFEDVHSAFTKPSNSNSEEATGAARMLESKRVNKQCKPDVIIDQPICENSLLSTESHLETCSELEEHGHSLHQMELHSDLHVTKATSVDDIDEVFKEKSNAHSKEATSAPDLVLKHTNEMHLEPQVLELQHDEENSLHFIENVAETSSTSEQNRPYPDAIEIHSDLHVVEAASPHGIHVVFNELPNGNIQQDEAGMNRVLELQACERQLEYELKVQAEELKTSSGVEHSGYKLGSETISDVSGFSSSSQQKLKKKKHKRSKSKSSTDSSSSSSSSDSA